MVLVERTFMHRLLSAAFLTCVTTVCMRGQTPATLQATPTEQAPAVQPRRVRTPAPTRDPHTPGYVTAKELPDGENAPSNMDGNFILGPTHNPAPEMTAQEGAPQGTV